MALYFSKIVSKKYNANIKKKLYQSGRVEIFTGIMDKLYIGACQT